MINREPDKGTADNPSAVSQAIEDLYRTFANCRKPASFEACPCCLSPEAIRRLLSIPLRLIPVNELWSYAECVFVTFEGQEEFFYFLPRILELAITEQLTWPDPERVGQSLKKADFAHWSPDRRKAIFKVCNAHFATLLEADNSEFEINRWLCALAHLSCEMRPYLNRLCGRPALLVGFYELHSQSLLKKRKPSGFSADCKSAIQEVANWLLSSEIQDAIGAAYEILWENPESSTSRLPKDNLPPPETS